MYQMTHSEHSAVLAGLRLLQREDLLALMEEVTTDGGTCEALSADQIDDLCEKLNFQAESPLLEFWRNNKVLETFISHHCNGLAPVGVVYTGTGEIVIANSQQDAFYVLRQEGDKVEVLRPTSALSLVDPEAEVEWLGEFESAEAALRAVCLAEAWEI